MMRKRFVQNMGGLVFLASGLVLVLLVWPIGDIFQTLFHNIFTWPWEDLGLGIGSVFAAIALTFVIGGWLYVFGSLSAYVLDPRWGKAMASKKEDGGRPEEDADVADRPNQSPRP